MAHAIQRRWQPLAQPKLVLDLEPQSTESIVSTANIPKINVRNSVIECAQSLKKENAGKYHNYGIKDCIASIAATKRK
jgi:hypothetical protein